MDHHQGQCLMMWSKRKYSTIPRTNNTTYLSSSSFSSAAASCYEVEESWEEKAFAKDAAGYIWPPRSYSCSFCRREFRSAQALGGHMNVHRRDRARLKQQQHQPSSPTINHDQDNNTIDDYDVVLEPHHHPGQNNSNFDYLYSNPNCYYYDLNPPKYGASSVSNNKLFKEGKAVIPLLNSSIFHGCLKRSSSTNSKSIIVSPHHHNLETLCDDEEKSDDDDGGVRLSLFVHRAKEEEDISSFKKRKTDDSLIPKSSSTVDVNHHNHVQSHKFHEFSSPNFIEEMDLELRLGYSSSQVYSSK
ncbi:hypothetical protein PIB30_079950 [Stylosanthes scabra]|uniref:C2H2-type domain-containing protein n=1 Tax=Stylosanthes scabra TaxID=79078 RepID=A0ABU6URB7_9FABA|nr:hypothetical protein [Stylosanthes scabra]